MAFGKKELILTGVAAMAVVCMGGVIGYQAFRSGKSLQQDGYVRSEERRVGKECRL